MYIFHYEKQPMFLKPSNNLFNYKCRSSKYSGNNIMIGRCSPWNMNFYLVESTLPIV